MLQIMEEKGSSELFLQKPVTEALVYSSQCTVTYSLYFYQ